MNARDQVEKIKKFINDYFSKNNLGGVVLGISGGKDSAVVLALMVNALGKDNIVGVTMPCHSNEQDRIDAISLANHYGIRLLNMDLTETFDTFTKEAMKLNEFVISEDSEINLKPRLRMSTLYYIAQMLSIKENKRYIVAGTSNKCEEYVGYFTKGGDSVCDIKVLSDFTVEEVYQLGEELNVPHNILYKTPSDGLSGKSDEEKLGVTYKDIAKVINKEEVSEDVKNKIDKMHQNNTHKFITPTYYQ